MSVIFKGRIVAGKLVVDAVPTAGSTNPVSSQGVKAALDAKQNTLTFDQTPTAGSQNPVTSGGVKSAINDHPDIFLGTTGWTLSNCTYSAGGFAKFGNLVIFQAIIVPTDGANTNTVYISLPSTLKPKANTALSCVNVTNDIGPYYALAGVDGNIVLNIPTLNRGYSVCGIWCLA